MNPITFIVYKSFDFTQLEIRSNKQNHLVMTIFVLGRGVSLDDQLRQEFAYKNGVLCYDSELDSVVESVYGKNHSISVPIKSMFKESKDYIKYGLCFLFVLVKLRFENYS